MDGPKYLTEVVVVAWYEEYRRVAEYLSDESGIVAWSLMHDSSRCSLDISIEIKTDIETDRASPCMCVWLSTNWYQCHEYHHIRIDIDEYMQDVWCACG